jgi:hypothetical protein
MSELSDALDKAMKQLFPTKARGVEPAVSAPFVRKKGDGISSVYTSRDLAYKQGTSDKVYHIQVVGESGDQYRVKFQYGRRRGTLIEGEKTHDPLELHDAMDIFRKVVDEKLSKGYR